MNDYIPWYITVGPKDKSFVVDGDNFVLSSDFPPHTISEKRAAKQRLHVLDLLDGKSQQDIIRIMAAALDQPNRLVEREISINSEGEQLRTIIIVGPINL
jgi:hypothetical protein